MFIDTEFNEYKGALISLALVADDGREWYGVRFCDDPGWWVDEHVMPHLKHEPQRDTDLRGSLATFLAGLDSVHIVSDWPGDIAHFCNFFEYRPGERIGPDCMTFEVRRDLPDTAITSALPHNALEDARAVARCHPKWDDPVQVTCWCGKSEVPYHKAVTCDECSNMVCDTCEVRKACLAKEEAAK